MFILCIKIKDSISAHKRSIKLCTAKQYYGYNYNYKLKSVILMCALQNNMLISVGKNFNLPTFHQHVLFVPLIYFYRSGQTAFTPMAH